MHSKCLPHTCDVTHPAHHQIGGPRADRATEELYHAIVRDDLQAVYDKIEEGADVNYVFADAYRCPEVLSSD